MAFTFNTPEDQRAMLEAIGVDRVEDLFDTIPESIQLNRPLDLPPGMGELELTQHMQRLAGKNRTTIDSLCFLGAGSYDHFVPAVVDAISGRSEFYSSYTPYQPEVSQGNLQVMFEYQTLICQLTGMDVSNASLYDGGSAVAEATLMSINVTRRDGRVVVLGNVHPEFRQILRTYLANSKTEITEVPCPAGTADLEQVEKAIDDRTACVVVQQPNFFGQLESLQTLSDLAHARGALLIASVDPISLGLLKRPGDLGADIVVAEGQSLGTPVSYGGPYLGIMACREKFVRRLPGRIAGQTVDRRGRRCWALTLQTREQHIRRDKATSNICTNQGLFALRASVYLAAMGPDGLKQVATLSAQKAHFAADLIAKSERFEIVSKDAWFKEFVVRDRDNDVSRLLESAAEQGVMAGVALGKWYPQMKDCFLVAVTEQRTRDEIERWANCLEKAGQTGSVQHA